MQTCVTGPAVMNLMTQSGSRVPAPGGFTPGAQLAAGSAQPPGLAVPLHVDGCDPRGDLLSCNGGLHSIASIAEQGTPAIETPSVSATFASSAPEPAEWLTLFCGLLVISFIAVRKL